MPRFVAITALACLAAIANRPLPIGEGQTISQPYIVALMTQLADIQPDDEMLEVGTGSGYQAAVLSELAGEVYTIEIVASLAERAGEQRQELMLLERSDEGLEKKDVIPVRFVPMTGRAQR